MKNHPYFQAGNYKMPSENCSTDHLSVCRMALTVGQMPRDRSIQPGSAPLVACTVHWWHLVVAYTVHW